eukprot:TRINITY_DN357_c1_g1_i4.p1 TRINITY_DN357_c1_g1~~TRINITY_DN357_c1_g1_i4.p1  ORF type:complete len:257 (+),score=54.88 TRINITY_DN357_c1_g1_i4:31-801(+)
MIHTIVGAALLGGVLGVSFCEEPGWNVVWKDDFNGNALDMTSWTILETQGDSRVRDACGRKENIQVVNGSLVITSKRETVEGCKYNFTTGAIQSEGKKFWQGHTRVCVSAKLPGTPGKAKGSWPAHWLMPNTSACWPTNGEIDILEMINGDGQAHGTYHWSDTCSQDHAHSGYATAADWASTFHEYSTEYSTSGLSFQVDSKQTSASLPPQETMYNVPYYAILQTALGGSWPGPVAPDTVFPMTHTIDYIVVSQKA